MNTAIENKPKRRYRKITPEVVARFKAERLIQGNSSAAVRVLEPEIKPTYVHERARRILRNSEEVSDTDYIEQRVEQIAVTAIDRVDELVNSRDEAVATRNAHFILEQKRGKAIQRNENRNIHLNIQSVLE